MGLPETLGGVPEAPQQVDVNPPEEQIFEPLGIATKQVGPDLWETRYLVSPFKMVTIRLNGEGKALLLKSLTGGIVIPS